MAVLRRRQARPAFVDSDGRRVIEYECIDYLVMGRHLTRIGGRRMRGGREMERRGSKMVGRSSAHRFGRVS